MALLTDYTGLVTSEHASKPNFAAVLAAILQPFVDEQNVLLTMPTKFDLDTATSAQLDATGKWIGLSRFVNTPIAGVYFAFDTAGVGFDSGVWFGPNSPAEGAIALDDDTYRAILRVKISANEWDGTLLGAENILQQILSPATGTYLFIQDNFDMSMSVAISGAIPSPLFQALITQQYIPLRPAGVLLSGVFMTSANNTPIFGFDIETNYVSGLDVGSWGTQLV